MSVYKTSEIEFIIEIVKAIYVNYIEETTQKLKNIDYINIEALKTKLETDLTDEKTAKDYQKIIATIESIIQD
ncbi:MAG: hypothetical protein AB7V50_06500 [Vampirovibrionia bacterium]